MKRKIKDLIDLYKWTINRKKILFKMHIRFKRINILNVDYLNLSSESIHDEIYDLKGIEGFVNLKRLYASGNRLSEVDLSKNILLENKKAIPKISKNSLFKFDTGLF